MDSRSRCAATPTRGGCRRATLARCRRSRAWASPARQVHVAIAEAQWRSLEKQQAQLAEFFFATNHGARYPWPAATAWQPGRPAGEAARTSAWQAVALARGGSDHGTAAARSIGEPEGNVSTLSLEGTRRSATIGAPANAPRSALDAYSSSPGHWQHFARSQMPLLPTALWIRLLYSNRALSTPDPAPWRLRSRSSLFSLQHPPTHSRPFPQPRSFARHQTFQIQSRSKLRYVPWRIVTFLSLRRVAGGQLMGLVPHKTVSPKSTRAPPPPPL